MNQSNENPSIVKINLDTVNAYQDAHKSIGSQLESIAEIPEQLIAPIRAYSKAIGKQIEGINSILTDRRNRVPKITIDGIDLINSAVVQYADIARRLAPSIREVAESIALSHTYQLAEAVKTISASTEGIVNSLYRYRNSILDEIDIREAHDVITENATKEEEETGQPIPYNVFSTDFIVGVYIPMIDLGRTLDNLDNVNIESIIWMIIVYGIPLTCYFVSKYKKDKIENDNDDWG